METLQIKQKQINPIPESIKIHTKNRWFFLYKWLTVENLKLSIWNYIKISIEIFILSFPILFFISFYISGTLGQAEFISIEQTYKILSYVILIFLVIFFLSLIFISLKSTKKFITNSYLIVTDKFIFIWWKKLKLSEFINTDNEYIKNIEKEFSKKIFQEDLWISKQKSNSIFKTFINLSQKIEWKSFIIKIIIFLLYLIYIISVTLYFFIYDILFNIIVNTLALGTNIFLNIRQNNVIKINELFNNLDEYSEELVKKNIILNEELNNAKNNERKDSLLIKINSLTEDVNKCASKIIKQIWKIKNRIKNSEFEEIFNFQIFNSWVKNQIYIPIFNIKKLLSKNLDIILKLESDLEKQIVNTNKDSLKLPLELQVKRLNIQKKQISKNINFIEIYLEKLIW